MNMIFFFTIPQAIAHVNNFKPIGFIFSHSLKASEFFLRFYSSPSTQQEGLQATTRRPLRQNVQTQRVTRLWPEGPLHMRDSRGSKVRAVQSSRPPPRHEAWKTTKAQSLSTKTQSRSSQLVRLQVRCVSAYVCACVHVCVCHCTGQRSEVMCLASDPFRKTVTYRCPQQHLGLLLCYQMQGWGMLKSKQRRIDKGM